MIVQSSLTEKGNIRELNNKYTREGAMSNIGAWNIYSEPNVMFTLNNANKA